MLVQVDLLTVTLKKRKRGIEFEFKNGHHITGPDESAGRKRLDWQADQAASEYKSIGVGVARC